MRPRRSCAYCGWNVAKIRRAGDPPTCVSCANLPRLEREANGDVERQLDLFYEGDLPENATNPRPSLDT